MTGGWRCPIGSAAGGRDRRRDDAEQWDDERIRADLEERRRAEAVAGREPEDDGLRADGAGDSHAERVAEQLAMADDSDDEALPPVYVGDHVVDRERDDPATTVVVGTPIETAAEYELDSGQTVADVNDEYPADADVVEVVFASRSDVSTRPLDRYAYPRPRLERVAALHDDADD